MHMGVIREGSAACEMRSSAKELGYELCLNESDLCIIAVNNPRDVVEHCSAMFTLWLDKRPNASLKILKEALVTVQLHSLTSIRLSSEQTMDITSKKSLYWSRIHIIMAVPTQCHTVVKKLAKQYCSIFIVYIMSCDPV